MIDDFYSGGNVDRNLWNKLLESNEFSSPFQTPDFLDFFNCNRDIEAEVFALGNEKEYLILSVVTLQKESGLKAYFSRRGIIYGGPLINSEINPEKLKFFFKRITDVYRAKAIYLEIRNYFDYNRFKDGFHQVGFKFVPWLNFQLEVKDYDHIKSKVSKSRFRQIKNAQKQGVEWRVANSEQEVKEYYKILEDLYRNKIKKPLFDLSFFLSFFHSNVGKYLLVYYNEKIIGGIMCPVLPNKSIYEFYVCGLDTEFKNQYPSIMATWAAIEYGLQNNIPLFDFMGAGSPDESYGVRDFKARFGGELVEHGRYLLILNPFLFKVGKWGLKVLSKIKS